MYLGRLILLICSATFLRALEDNHAEDSSKTRDVQPIKKVALETPKSDMTETKYYKIDPPERNPMKKHRKSRIMKQRFLHDADEDEIVKKVGQLLGLEIRAKNTGDTKEMLTRVTRPVKKKSKPIEDKNGAIISNTTAIPLVISTKERANFKERSEDSDSIEIGLKDDIDGMNVKEEDIIEAANLGMQAMNDLYYIKEPNLYTKGLFLRPDNPALYVARFNEQSEEARKLARYGYAALEATKAFHQKYSGLSRQVPVNIDSSKSNLARQCPKRGIPHCVPVSLRYRTADGSCNNPTEHWWGSALSSMQRFLPPVYQDGIDRIRLSVTGVQLPSAREVSQVIHEDKDAPIGALTHMIMQWGQFVDHDVTATGQNTGFNGTVPQCCLNRGIDFQPPEFMHPECLPISVNPSDRFFGKLEIKCLEFLRSGSVPREDCGFGPREQLSQVTSFIDASHIYGSSPFRSDSLRTFRNGLLKYGRRDSNVCQRGSVSTSCFQAGDLRFSEQPSLTSLHTVFLRYHNKIAAQLAAFNRHWNDERIFQETRRIIGAVVQIITYREFLPLVLGPDVMKIFDLEVARKGTYYTGYDPAINPSISNEFSTAAYRFGHSLVQSGFSRYDKNHRLLFNNVSIHKEFSHLENLQTAGSLEKIVLGLMNQPCQRADEFISSELTNHLFQPPGVAFGLDLASQNIQRGRDHGLAPYVAWRTPCGLAAINNWDDMKRSMSEDVVEKFRFLYASVEDVDLYPAGLAEKPVPHGMVGPTFACIIAQQFQNLRKGDRFWFENPHEENAFTMQQLEQIRHVTLSQILCRTLDVFETIQPFAFLTPDRSRNKRRPCNDRSMNNFSLRPWKEQEPKQEQVNEEEDWEEIVEPDFAGEENQSRAANKAQQRLSPMRQKPFKTKINQQNRILVKRPLAPTDNLTIFVQNNAVNAPIFVKDAHISNSKIQINQASSTTKPRPQFDQYENADYEKPSYPENQPGYEPVQIPQPILNPYGNGPKPYFPQNFNDPSNPNPPYFGYNANPVNNFVPNNAYFNNRPSMFNSLYPQFFPSNYFSHQPPFSHGQVYKPYPSFAASNNPVYGNGFQNQQNPYVEETEKFSPIYTHGRFSTESYPSTSKNDFLDNTRDFVSVNSNNTIRRSDNFDLPSKQKDQEKSGDDLKSSIVSGSTTKPGSYFYDRNVLYRYQDNMENSTELKVTFRNKLTENEDEFKTKIEDGDAGLSATEFGNADGKIESWESTMNGSVESKNSSDDFDFRKILTVTSDETVNSSELPRPMQLDKIH